MKELLKDFSNEEIINYLNIREVINEQKNEESNEQSNEYINQLSKDVNLDKPSKEDLRLLRLAYYDKQKTII